MLIDLSKQVGEFTVSVEESMFPGNRDQGMSVPGLYTLITKSTEDGHLKVVPECLSASRSYPPAPQPSPEELTKTTVAFTKHPYVPDLEKQALVVEPEPTPVFVYKDEPVTVESEVIYDSDPIRVAKPVATPVVEPVVEPVAKPVAEPVVIETIAAQDVSVEAMSFVTQPTTVTLEINETTCEFSVMVSPGNGKTVYDWKFREVTAQAYKDCTGVKGFSGTATSSLKINLKNTPITSSFRCVVTRGDEKLTSKAAKILPYVK